MQIKETVGVSFRGPVESQSLEDVVVLVDSAGFALGAQRGFSSRVRNVGDRGFVTSRCVEIPLVGPDGEVSGVLYYSSPRSYSHLVIAPNKPERASEIVESAQFIVHDINNLLAVISSGLRLLECQDDAEDRKAIVGKLQETITRGAFLTRRLLGDARPRAKPIDGYVDGRRLAAIASSLDRAFHPDITIRMEIAPDLWAFNADAEDLYFALLNLCRNAADAMPEGGIITIAARNVEHSAGATQGFVEIVVADDGMGMPEEVLSQAFTRYFTTKPASNLNRPPTDCGGTPARGRATLSSQSSHLRMRGVAINPSVFVGHGWLMAAIVAGLAIGKPLGIFLAATAAVRTGIAVKPTEYTWRQLAGAGALAGIGFTMSLFIAGQAFPNTTDFSAAKIAVFAASMLSAVFGAVLLWGASREEPLVEAAQSPSIQV